MLHFLLYDPKQPYHREKKQSLYDATSATLPNTT